MNQDNSHALVHAGSWMRKSSPEEAARLCSEAFYRQRLDLLDRSGRFALSQRHVRLGPITIGDITVGSDVRLDCGELGTSYHVNLPLTGRLESCHRGTRVTATPERAAVYRPDGETVLTRWAAGCRQLCVKIDRAAVDSTLEAALGRPVVAPIAFAPSTDITGPARSWAALLLLVTHRLGGTDSVVQHSLVALPLIESLVSGLLLAVDHPYREALEQPGEPSRPPAVRTAVDIMRAEPQAPLTTAAIAAQCHVSVRSLQEGFQRHVGMSPMAYLRRVRLRRAHEDLLAGDPFGETVASIAHRWGFTHLGRFAAAHEAAYGEPPLGALRSIR